MDMVRIWMRQLWAQPLMRARGGGAGRGAGRGEAEATEGEAQTGDEAPKDRSEMGTLHPAVGGKGRKAPAKSQFMFILTRRNTVACMRQAGGSATNETDRLVSYVRCHLHLLLRSVH